MFYYYSVLESSNCEHISTIAPLNDLLLGQTFIIEANEQQLFVDGTQVNYFDISLYILFNKVHLF